MLGGSLLASAELSFHLKWTTHAIVSKSFTELHKCDKEGRVWQLVRHFAQSLPFLLCWCIDIVIVSGLVAIASLIDVALLLHGLDDFFSTSPVLVFLSERLDCASVKS